MMQLSISLALAILARSSILEERNLNPLKYFLEVDVFIFLSLPLKTKNVNFSKTHTMIHLIIHPSNLNATHHNSYSVSSDQLEIEPEFTMDYSFENPFDSPQHS